MTYVFHGILILTLSPFGGLTLFDSHCIHVCFYMAFKNNRYGFKL